MFVSCPVSWVGQLVIFKNNSVKNKIINKWSWLTDCSQITASLSHYRVPGAGGGQTWRWPWHHPLCLSDGKYVGVCKATETQGAHSSGRGLQPEIQKILLTAHWFLGRAYLTRYICPHCPHFTAHKFIFSLHVFYHYPMGPANFCSIPHAHVFFSKWQPDPHDSSSEIIFFYRAPTGTKFQLSPNNQPRCWVPLVSGCFSHTCGN